MVNLPLLPYGMICLWYLKSIILNVSYWNWKKFQVIFPWTVWNWVEIFSQAMAAESQYFITQDNLLKSGRINKLPYKILSKSVASFLLEVFFKQKRPDIWIISRNLNKSKFDVRIKTYSSDSANIFTIHSVFFCCETLLFFYFRRLFLAGVGGSH